MPAEPDAEPAVALAAMTAGRQVVEDYRSTGLSLRRHPVSFLRRDLAARRIIRCSDLLTVRDGKRVEVAGIILVRQRPGSARGVLFVTIEDETGHANLILWPSVFEAQRRLVLSASMIACRGKLQREGEVLHVIAEHLTDLSDLLRGVGERDEAFPLVHGRGDEAKHGGAPDPREKKRMPPSRDIYVRDLRAGHQGADAGFSVGGGGDPLLSCRFSHASAALSAPDGSGACGSRIHARISPMGTARSLSRSSRW